MDLNEQIKGLLLGQAQPGSFTDKAGLALSQAGQTIAKDAAAVAAIMNDPRNSWIGMNPVGKAVGSGLGLMGMLSAGGGKAVLHPLMVGLIEKGEKLSRLQEAVRQQPEMFGFANTSAWRKSLPQEDLHALFAWEMTGDRLARQAVKLEGELGPNDAFGHWSKAVAPQESDAMYGLGLSPMQWSRKMPDPPQQP